MVETQRLRHQFGIRTLLGLTTGCAAMFAAFRWLGLGLEASLFVAAVLGVALLGSMGLVVAIGRSANDSRPDRDVE